MSAKMLFLINVIIPIIVSSIYFIMALYIKKIKPLRVLIIGEKTYQYAFWIFFLFGLYLVGRPIQILSGIPLIISSAREFIIISLMAPCVLLGILNHIYFDRENHFSNSKRFVFLVFSFCLILGILFIYFNVSSISGLKQIFRYEFFNIHIIGLDGNWFSGSNKNLKFLFIIRLISPILIMLTASIFVLRKAIIYPKDTLYNNLPKKFFLLGFAILVFIIFLVTTGIIAYFKNYQTQWYYFGALLAGILGFISLSIPPRDFVIKNDVKNRFSNK